MIKRFEICLYIRLDSRCNGTKNVIKLIGNVIWVSNEFTLIVKNYFGRYRFFSVKGNYLFNSLGVFDIVNVVSNNNYYNKIFYFLLVKMKLFLCFIFLMNNIFTNNVYFYCLLCFLYIVISLYLQ